MFQRGRRSVPCTFCYSLASESNYPAKNRSLNHGIHRTHGNEDIRKSASSSVCSVYSVVITNLSLAVGRHQELFAFTVGASCWADSKPDKRTKEDRHSNSVTRKIVSVSLAYFRCYQRTPDGLHMRRFAEKLRIRRHWEMHGLQKEWRLSSGTMAALMR